MTDATQALLPVTQSDRERAAEIAENLAINSDLFPALIRNGQHDKHPFVQSYARHRQAHSLPGDEDRQALDEIHLASLRALNRPRDDTPFLEILAKHRMDTERRIVDWLKAEYSSACEKQEMPVNAIHMISTIGSLIEERKHVEP